MELLSAHIENMRQKDNDASNKIIESLNWRLVKEACKKMKSGKTDVSGSYASEVLLEAPNSLYIHLSEVFKSFLVHGNVTKEILNCAFLPYYKGGFKDASKFDSYRL